MNKPKYRTSKRIIWLNTIAAWLVIMVLAIGAAQSGEAVAFGTIALPSMVLLIAGLTGIHRGFGSMDMRTQQQGNEQVVPQGSLTNEKGT